MLAWERGLNLWAEEGFRRMNSDEKKVRSYTLPPLPDTLEEWEKQRPVILRQVKECLYGVLPPAPDRLELMKYCRFCKKHTAHRETR